MYGAGSDRRKITVLASGVSIDSTAKRIHAARMHLLQHVEDRELDVLARERLAVVEPDTLLQLEGDRLAVRAHRP